MTNELIQQKAQNAKDILDNETFKEAMLGIKKEIILAWSECPSRDLEGKDYLWQLYKSAEKFESVLTGFIESGKFDSSSLKNNQNKFQQILGVFK